MEELKPCPFCGGKATLRYTKANPNGMASNILKLSEKGFVSCLKCSIGTKEYSNMSRAIDVWNRRAYETD